MFLEVRFASQWVLVLLFSLNVFVGNYRKYWYKSQKFKM